MTTYPEVSAVTRMIGSRILWVSLLFYAANAHARVAPTSSLLLRSLLLSVTINLHRAGVPYQHNFLPFYSSSHTSSLYRDLRKPLNRVFQTVSCWSSVSASGRTHQLRAGTHAIRHNQQVTTPRVVAQRDTYEHGGSRSPPEQLGISRIGLHSRPRTLLLPLGSFFSTRKTRGINHRTFSSGLHSGNVSEMQYGHLVRLKVLRSTITTVV